MAKKKLRESQQWAAAAPNRQYGRYHDSGEADVSVPLKEEQDRVTPIDEKTTKATLPRGHKGRAHPTIAAADMPSPIQKLRPIA
jgi:hypothetical protein